MHWTPNHGSRLILLLVGLFIAIGQEGLPVFLGLDLLIWIPVGMFTPGMQDIIDYNELHLLQGRLQLIFNGRILNFFFGQLLLHSAHLAYQLGILFDDLGIVIIQLLILGLKLHNLEKEILIQITELSVHLHESGVGRSEVHILPLLSSDLAPEARQANQAMHKKENVRHQHLIKFQSIKKQNSLPDKDEPSFIQLIE